MTPPFPEDHPIWCLCDDNVCQGFRLFERKFGYAVGKEERAYMRWVRRWNHNRGEPNKIGITLDGQSDVV
jgi:hypothetical protein